MPTRIKDTAPFLISAGRELRFSPEGRPYYTDHNTQTNHWEPPSAYAVPAAGPPGVGVAEPDNPDELYDAQIAQLIEMGFTDTSANLAALCATNGDVAAAIERL